MNKFTLIKTLLGEEVFYGVQDELGNKEETLSVSREEVEVFVEIINKKGDVFFEHINDLFKNYMYEKING